MRLVDRTRPHHQGLQPQFLQPGCLRGKSNGVCRVPREFLTGFDQSGVGRGFKRRHAVKQGGKREFEFPPLGQRLHPVKNRLAQGVHVHARQRTQVEVQFALGADAIGIVTTVDTAQVQGGHLYLEVGVAVLFLPFAAQGQQFAERLVHAFQRVAAQGRVGGMARLPVKPQPLHHDALVHAHWFEIGGLADHRVTGFRFAGFCQCPGAIHRAFFVSSGQDNQWLLQGLAGKGPGGFNGQREKALHIAGAQTVPAVVLFRETERITLPAFVVKRYGVGMA